MQVMISPRCKCRILFVIDDMGIGGAQKQVSEVVKRLDPGSFVADIVCIETGGVMLEGLTGAHRVFVLGARRVFDHKGFAATARLARILRRGRYDVVEAYLPAAHFMCAVAAPAAGRTALVAARRNLAWLDPKWFAASRRLVNRATHFSIANSQAVKWSVVVRYGVTPSRIGVVPNIVDKWRDGISRDAARRQLGLGVDTVVVAAAGTISRVKDYPTIVRAFAQLSAAGRSTALLIAGDGPARTRLKGLCARLGARDRIRFLGAVSDIRPVLAAADVFIHASLSEGSSNAVLEAMSYALPTVASDIPANRELLGGECARFFKPGDWRGCLEALETFAGDPAAAAAAGQSARKRVAAVFDSGNVIRRREKLYRRIAEVINGNGNHG